MKIQFVMLLLMCLIISNVHGLGTPVEGDAYYIYTTIGGDQFSHCLAVGLDDEGWGTSDQCLGSNADNVFWSAYTSACPKWTYHNNQICTAGYASYLCLEWCGRSGGNGGIGSKEYNARVDWNGGDPFTIQNNAIYATINEKTCYLQWSSGSAKNWRTYQIAQWGRNTYARTKGRQAKFDCDGGADRIDWMKRKQDILPMIPMLPTNRDFKDRYTFEISIYVALIITVSILINIFWLVYFCKGVKKTQYVQYHNHKVVAENGV